MAVRTEDEGKMSLKITEKMRKLFWWEISEVREKENTSQVIKDGNVVL